MLQGKHIIITGAAGAIGQSLAGLLLDAGASVTVIDIAAEGLEALKEQYPEIDTHVCDLTNEDAVATLFNTLFEKGLPNVLVNNAGAIVNRPLVNLLDRKQPVHSLSKWRKAVQSNLDTTFLCGANFAHQLIKKRKKGVIINISSVSAQGNIGQSAYSAAKAGAEALAVVWSKELGPWGIRSVAIAPGFFDTASTHDALSDEQLDKWRKTVPLRKLGTMEQLANAIQFCIENDYFNGKTLRLDGGLTI